MLPLLFYGCLPEQLGLLIFLGWSICFGVFPIIYLSPAQRKALDKSMTKSKEAETEADV